MNLKQILWIDEELYLNSLAIYRRYIESQEEIIELTPVKYKQEALAAVKIKKFDLIIVDTRIPYSSLGWHSENNTEPRKGDKFILDILNDDEVVKIYGSMENLGSKILVLSNESESINDLLTKHNININIDYQNKRNVLLSKLYFLQFLKQKCDIH